MKHAYVITTLDQLDAFIELHQTATLLINGEAISKGTILRGIFHQPPLLLIYDDAYNNVARALLPNDLNYSDLITPDELASGEYVIASLPTKATTLSIEQVFVTFLKKHRAYTKFLRNYRNLRSYERALADPRTTADIMLIRCAFAWDESPEPLDYWTHLSRKWELLCAHFNISKTIVGVYYDKLPSR